MTRRERVQAALRGEPVDRAPISLWHHFPGQDDSAEALAAVTVAFQARYDCDLVKLMPTGMYPVMDYGVEVRPSGDAIGTTRFVRGPIREPADWSRLPDVAPDRGMLGEQVETVRLARAHLDPETPAIQTIFSPLTMAAKLAGGNDPMLSLAAHDSVTLEAVLGRLADDVIKFGRACLAAGADGFFFATQLAARSFEPVYRRFGVPYDLRVLERLRDQSWCTILHLHGSDPLFELADEYPIDAVNWHDRDTRPTLSESLTRTRRTLVAGIARGGAIAQGRPQEVAAEVHDAVRQTVGRRLIVAPGCVIPHRAPEQNLEAARRAVDEGAAADD